MRRYLRWGLIVGMAASNGCSSTSDSSSPNGTGGASGVPADASADSSAVNDAEPGACLGDIAWYTDNSTGKAVAPAQKTPNAFGLYDMLGNAVEWVEDCYHETYAGAPSDASAWESADCEYRVIRGGCYGSTARATRVSWRDGVKTSFYGACAPGVRCVRTSSDVPAGAKVTLVWASVPAGTMEIGCSGGDVDCFDNESPTRSVAVPAFEMTAHEVTQQQFFDQTGDSPAADWCAECAETYVSWEQAKAFCEAVGGRLPTEVEWEYAARGGKKTPYYCQ